MINRIFYTLVTIAALFANHANGAPMAYSVNSDGQNEATSDSLYLIDLDVSASDQRRGTLFSGGYSHYDTEGLAFGPDGTLWGVDDGSMTLFPIDPQTGTINFNDVVTLPALPAGGGNDFGMTFTCDGMLYLTSMVNQTLYQVDTEGNSRVVGNLGANISAIAAIGNPTQLYGLGNGLRRLPSTGALVEDSPNLYRIDTETGVATIVGPLTNALDYQQGGLAFDGDGNLWAITDRSGEDRQGISNQPSQVLAINTETGEATPVSMTAEVGFESLAIAPPSSCTKVVPGVFEDPYHRIPTLGPFGLLAAIFGLLFAGLLVLRRHQS